MLFYFQVVPLIVYISRKPNKKKTEKQGKGTLSLLRENKFKKLGLQLQRFFLSSDEEEVEYENTTLVKKAIFSEF